MNIVEDKVHVHDLQATILHCLGLEHTRLTYHHMGRDFRLTDVAGKCGAEDASVSSIQRIDPAKCLRRHFRTAPGGRLNSEVASIQG